MHRTHKASCGRFPRPIAQLNMIGCKIKWLESAEGYLLIDGERSLELGVLIEHAPWKDRVEERQSVFRVT